MKPGEVKETGSYTYIMPRWREPENVEIFIENDILRMKWIGSKYKTLPLDVNSLPDVAILTKKES